jgi:capsular polysaccharide biosynthesis protein
MALSAYLRIVLKWWWLILLIVGMTLIATAVFLSRQPKIYESSATFVVKPRDANAEELVRAIDTLSRRVEINSTYADISESKLVEERAIERLQLSSADTASLKITSRVVTGTNLLKISGRASQPELAQAFTSAVADVTAEYITNLGDVFTLESLDPPSGSRKPVSPRSRSTMMLGGLLGIGLGLGLALTAEVLGRKSEDADVQGRAEQRLLDEEIGSYGRRYFGHLVTQAAYRAKRGADDGFTIAVFGVTRGALQPGADALRAVAADLDGWLREEDVLGHLGQGQLSVLLPNTEPAETDSHIERYRMAIEQILKQKGSEASIAVGTVTLPNGSSQEPDALDDHEIISMARHALLVASIP